MMRQTFLRGICAASVALSALACTAEDNNKIVKIEEDWELVINDPDPASCSPQVTLFTSPSVNSDDDYFQLQLNYSADSIFSSGGFHVSAFGGADLKDEARSDNQTVLNVSGDTIRWTSVMAVIDQRLLFAVKNGHSQTWGEFGGPEYLIQMLSNSYHDLSEYHPKQSLETVDIGFGANRIDSLILRCVRVYYADGRAVSVPVNRQPTWTTPNSNS